jgi:hypothetical protein
MWARALGPHAATRADVRGHVHVSTGPAHTLNFTPPRLGTPSALSRHPCDAIVPTGGPFQTPLKLKLKVRYALFGGLAPTRSGFPRPDQHSPAQPGPIGLLRSRPPGIATLRRVAAPEQDEGFVEKLSRQGEEALGRVAEELIANPVVNAAIARAFEAREKAVQAQEAALGALNLPSAADIERVTRRLRSLSQRLEGIEDAIDRLEERVATVGASGRLASVETRLDEIARDLARVREAVSPSEDPVPRAQERLTVTES